MTAPDAMSPPSTVEPDRRSSNRRLGWTLFLVFLGLTAFAIVYIVIRSHSHGS